MGLLLYIIEDGGLLRTVRTVPIRNQAGYYAFTSNYVTNDATFMYSTADAPENIKDTLKKFTEKFRRMRRKFDVRFEIRFTKPVVVHSPFLFLCLRWRKFWWKYGLTFRGFRGTIQTAEGSPNGERFGELFTTTFHPTVRSGGDGNSGKISAGKYRFRSKKGRKSPKMA